MTTQTPSIDQAVRDFVLENFLFTRNPAALSDTDSFLGAGIIDSTGVLELILFLEQHFAIKVAEKEMVQENFDSVQKIAAYVRAKQPVPV
jgi:acyl carrier protein